MYDVLIRDATIVDGSLGTPQSWACRVAIGDIWSFYILQGGTGRPCLSYLGASRPHSMPNHQIQANR